MDPTTDIQEAIPRLMRDIVDVADGAAKSSLSDLIANTKRSALLLSTPPRLRAPRHNFSEKHLLHLAHQDRLSASIAYLGNEAVPLSLMSANFVVPTLSALLWAIIDAPGPNQGVASNGTRLLHLILPSTHGLVVKPKNSSA